MDLKLSEVEPSESVFDGARVPKDPILLREYALVRRIESKYRDIRILRESEGFALGEPNWDYFARFPVNEFISNHLEAGRLPLEARVAILGSLQKVSIMPPGLLKFINKEIAVDELRRALALLHYETDNGLVQFDIKFKKLYVFEDRNIYIESCSLLLQTTSSIEAIEDVPLELLLARSLQKDPSGIRFDDIELIKQAYGDDCLITLGVFIAKELRDNYNSIIGELTSADIQNQAKELQHELERHSADNPNLYLKLKPSFSVINSFKFLINSFQEGRYSNKERFISTPVRRQWKIEFDGMPEIITRALTTRLPLDRVKHYADLYSQYAVSNPTILHKEDDFCEDVALDLKVLIESLAIS